MIDATTHDTRNPLDCCDRCRTAELGRRSTRRPVIRYTQTASSGRVDVVRGTRQVATLVKDSLFGWYVEASDLDALRDMPEGLDRRELLDLVVVTYTRLWRAGTVR